MLLFLKNNLSLSFIFLLMSLYGNPALNFEELVNTDNIILTTKRIYLDDFPDAHNPSIIQFKDEFLLVFRYIPDPENQLWMNQIGVVLLDHSLLPISKPQLLNTRPKNSKTPSQAEDARIFSHKGRLFLIYNDNVEVVNPWCNRDRRDMFVAELFYKEGVFSLSPPLKLIYPAGYSKQLWQKNWVPFDWNGKLFLTYTLNPHEILVPNFLNGECHQHCQTSPPIDWKWGTLRGSTPPQLVDGEYLAFFHSAVRANSCYSLWNFELWHYFMGAYTFSDQPPFQITKMSPHPLVVEGFYTPATWEKRVIFPGGFVVLGRHIYLAYGKDDCEIWIAILDKEELKKSLKPL